MKVILLALFCSQLFANAARAEYITGLDIHDWCRADTNTVNGKESTMQLFGYIQGSLDQMELSNMLCLPEGEQTGALRLNICRWLDAHPQMVPAGGRTVMWQAVTALYPCAKK